VLILLVSSEPYYLRERPELDGVASQVSRSFRFGNSLLRSVLPRSPSKNVYIASRTASVATLQLSTVKVFLLERVPEALETSHPDESDRALCDPKPFSNLHVWKRRVLEK
jgi:hypothetical protein